MALGRASLGSSSLPTDPGASAPPHSSARSFISARSRGRVRRRRCFRARLTRRSVAAQRRAVRGLKSVHQRLDCCTNNTKYNAQYSNTSSDLVAPRAIHHNRCGAEAAQFNERRGREVRSRDACGIRIGWDVLVNPALLRHEHCSSVVGHNAQVLIGDRVNCHRNSSNELIIIYNRLAIGMIG